MASIVMKITFSAVLVLTCVRSGNTAVTPSSASQSEITLQNLTDLLTIAERAKYEAGRSYNITCGRMSNYCDERRMRALTSAKYPSFDSPQSDNAKDQLRDMYHVVFQFSKLTGKFVDDVQNQVVWRGRDSSDYESLNSLNTMLWWMKYVIAELRRLVPEVVPPSSSPDIDDDPDVSTRNNKNIAIAARAACELGKMCNNLKAIVCARNSSANGC